MGEPGARSMLELMRRDQLAIGSPTRFEFLLVASHRKHNGEQAARRLLSELRVVVIEWTERHSDLAADAFQRFGKGRNPAKLNFGDCMAYAVAKALDAPLLFKGGDFPLTDVKIAT